MAQLEAEIAQLKDALAGGSRSEWRPGWWPSASPTTPSGPGHCWYASPKNGHVKVRNIAQAIINPHCSRLSQADIEIAA